VLYPNTCINATSSYAGQVELCCRATLAESSYAGHPVGQGPWYALHKGALVAAQQWLSLQTQGLAITGQSPGNHLSITWQPPGNHLAAAS